MSIYHKVMNTAEWIQDLEREIEENGGELTTILEKESEVLEKARESGLEELAKWYWSVDAEYQGLAEFAQRIASARRSRKNRMEFIKRLASLLTEKTERTKLGTWSPRSKRNIDFEPDFKGIAEKYLISKPSLNRKLVNAELDEGVSIDGIRVTEERTATLYRPRANGETEDKELDGN